MKIPLIGGHNRRRSVNHDGQRTVNLYIETDSAEPETGAALYMVPGKKLFVTVGTGPVRAMLTFGVHIYAVSGENLYRIAHDGGVVDIGALILDESGVVAMSSNRTQVVVVSGDNLYITDGVTLDRIEDDAFAGSFVVDYLDGYSIYAIPDTQQFYLSALNNAGSFDALDFAQAETAADGIVSLIVDHQELWLFGETTTEIWYNSGASDFPLARRDGAILEAGCAARGSVAQADNTIFWLGRSKSGGGVVYRADQYNPQIISNRGIEYEISQIADVSDAIAFAYQYSGHTFYVLTFPSAGKTFVYDASIPDPDTAWHVRESFGIGRDRANCHAYAWNRHLVGDYDSGSIWEMRDDVYTDGGDPILWERTTTRIMQDGNRIFFRNMTINIERGTGISSGQGSDPIMYLDWSDDGGHTWCSKREASMGAMGNYKPVVTFNRLGSSRDRVFRLTGSEPVKTVILGGYLTAEAGEN